MHGTRNMKQEEG